MTKELSLTSEWLVIERAREKVVEASMEIKSGCLDEIMVECVKLHLLSADIQNQMEKDLAETWMALDKVEARVVKAEARA